MSRPPRIPVWIPPDQPVIYFITICVHERQPALANARVWECFRATLFRLDQWLAVAGVLMPNHLHILTGPLDRDASVSGYSKCLKRWMTEALEPSWRWQEGCFDRLLRSWESAHSKWLYIRENPVRHKLVSRWNDWPYQFGFQRPNSTKDGG